MLVYDALEKRKKTQSRLFLAINQIPPVRIFFWAALTSIGQDRTLWIGVLSSCRWIKTNTVLNEKSHFHSSTTDIIVDTQIPLPTPPYVYIRRKWSIATKVWDRAFIPVHQSSIERERKFQGLSVRCNYSVGSPIFDHTFDCSFENRVIIDLKGQWFENYLYAKGSKKKGLSNLWWKCQVHVRQVDLLGAPVTKSFLGCPQTLVKIKPMEIVNNIALHFSNKALFSQLISASMGFLPA